MEYFRARLILDAFCKVFVRSRLIAFERERNQDSNLFPFFLQSGQPETAVASGSPGQLVVSEQETKFREGTALAIVSPLSSNDTLCRAFLPAACVSAWPRMRNNAAAAAQCGARFHARFIAL